MISLGFNSKIDDSVKVFGEVEISVGDCSYIGPGVKIAGSGKIKIGDYCKIHAGSFINLDGGSVSMGHNCWIGERSVIDGRGMLRMGNNVGVGIASQLYSHIAHGDTIEGCNLYGNKSLILEDDVWLVGQCFLSPIHAQRKSVAMLGAVIIKDMHENRVYSGNPAVDVTAKLGQPWSDKNYLEKLGMLSRRLHEFNLKFPDHEKECREMIVPCNGFPAEMHPDKTYIDVNTRTYTKRLSPIEVKFFSWLTSYKGRFTPKT